jgi:hypothetical protein
LLIDVTADWCQPCKHMDSTTWIDPTVAARLGAGFVAIQVTMESEEVKPLRVRAVPTVILLRDGKELDRITGARPPTDLLAWLDRVAAGTTELDRLRAAPREDLAARLQLATGLVGGELDDEALEEFTWLWDHSLEVNPPWVGVRHSFLIAALKPLVARSERARERFVERRDAAEKRLAELPTFMDWVTLNGLLGDTERVVTWLEEVPVEVAAAVGAWRNWGVRAAA